MYKTFLDELVGNLESFLIHGDRLFKIDTNTSSSHQGNALVQNTKRGGIYFPLTYGTPLSEMELSDRLVNRHEIDHQQEMWIKDKINKEEAGFMDFSSRYKLLRFIVDELFPRMVAPPVEERIDAYLEGNKEIKTGKEIIEEGLGEDIKKKPVKVPVEKLVLERTKDLVNRETIYRIRVPEVHEAQAVLPKTQTPSILSAVIRNAPIIFIGGKPYYLTKEEQDTDLRVEIDGERYGYDKGRVIFYKSLLGYYQKEISKRVREEAFVKLEARLQEAKDIIINEVDYMPIMDVDEFRFRDIGFMRDGNVYYVFIRIPWFARQTTYDENLFAVKEKDEDGYSGQLGIGLTIEGDVIRYTRQVKYWGPIKHDAPFTIRDSISDPVLSQKYGTLTTVCHRTGYPTFPMTPDGFTQFLDYALSNFLHSFRDDFILVHADSEEQRKLLDSGRITTKEEAIKKGIMLTNIHKLRGRSR